MCRTVTAPGLLLSPEDYRVTWRCRGGQTWLETGGGLRLFVEVESTPRFTYVELNPCDTVPSLPSTPLP